MRRPDTIDRVVGANIRAIRNARGMSQTDLANEIGVSFQQVQKYERGMNRIGSSRLWKIAMILDVQFQQLYRGVAIPSGKTEPPVHLIAKKDALKLARAFDKIQTREVRTVVVELVQKLAELY